MGLLDKLFNKKNELSQDSNKAIPKVEIGADGNSITIGNIGKNTFQSGYVGSATGSSFTDFYVYEWFIKETGEIFYVGKGRGDRYKEYHERAYEAEKIRKLYNTDVRFVAKNLTEEQALEIESEEMTRILNETNYRLTNRNTPFFTKRDNGYSRSPNTPPLMFETAPVLYACEIDEHYFDIKPRPFDKVKSEDLTFPAIIDRVVSREELDIVYGGKYEKYYREVISLLERNGSKIIKTKYAKSVTAWIYPCDDYVTNYDIDEANAHERIGRRIPVYHLIDVWKFLKAQFGNVELQQQDDINIAPVHNRVPLSQIKNLHNWDKGFDAGFEYWEQGESERKNGSLEKAIQLFDKARYNGYFAPAMYKSYAMAYRKLKDLDNEIAILDEAIERFRTEDRDYSQEILSFEDQKRKAIDKLMRKK